VIRHGDILITPSLFELDEIVNGRRYVGVGIMAGSREGTTCCVFECLLCGEGISMRKPKFSINERVMVRCHACHCLEGRSLCIDDCVIVQIEVILSGEDVIIHEGRRFRNKEDIIQYKVDRHDSWIDEDFIFPYQQPGSSFKEQMQELDRPIKQLEPA